MTGFARVRGICPMGCGRTLYLNDEGLVMCSKAICIQPWAASEALGVRFPTEPMAVALHSPDGAGEALTPDEIVEKRSMQFAKNRS